MYRDLRGDVVELSVHSGTRNERRVRAGALAARAIAAGLLGELDALDERLRVRSTFGGYIDIEGPPDHETHLALSLTAGFVVSEHVATLAEHPHATSVAVTATTHHGLPCWLWLALARKRDFPSAQHQIEQIRCQGRIWPQLAHADPAPASKPDLTDGVVQIEDSLFCILATTPRDPTDNRLADVDGKPGLASDIARHSWCQPHLVDNDERIQAAIAIATPDTDFETEIMPELLGRAVRTRITTFNDEYGTAVIDGDRPHLVISCALCDADETLMRLDIGQQLKKAVIALRERNALHHPDDAQSTELIPMVALTTPYEVPDAGIHSISVIALDASPPSGSLIHSLDFARELKTSLAHAGAARWLDIGDHGLCSDPRLLMFGYRNRPYICAAALRVGPPNADDALDDIERLRCLIEVAYHRALSLPPH